MAAYSIRFILNPLLFCGGNNPTPLRELRGSLTNNGQFTFTYNHAGRLTRAQSITATQVYTYNGDGLLMNRSAARFVWDQAADLPQMLSDGSTLYVPGVGQWNGTSWAYELRDGLGSVRQLSDASGNLVQTYTYAPFGELLAAQGTRSSALQYTGEQKDVDTGLVYLRARWYDSATGRFTTRDPFPGFAALPQTLHPYVYVNNNPVNLTDPSGKIAFLPLLVVAILGGVIGGVSYYTLQAVLNADPCLGVQWHWQEALFWGGAGGVIGGLIGAAAYGGWQLGAKAIAWIRAISGGATTCATNESCRNTVLKGLEVFQRAAEFGINTYKDLRKLTEGTGLQVHHIIEQRFASLLKMNPDDMLSVVLTRGEHDKFTRLWQQAIGYSHWLSRNLRTDTASVEDIWKAAQEIYKDYPVLLEAAKKTLELYQLNSCTKSNDSEFTPAPERGPLAVRARSRPASALGDQSL